MVKLVDLARRLTGRPAAEKDKPKQASSEASAASERPSGYSPRRAARRARKARKK